MLFRTTYSENWRVLPADQICHFSVYPEVGMELVLKDGTTLRVISVNPPEKERELWTEPVKDHAILTPETVSVVP